MARIRADAIAVGAQRGVRRRNANLFWEPCADRWKMCTCHRGCRNTNLIPTMAREFTKWQCRRLFRTGLAKVKSRVKLNFGLSPDFSVQLKVSLSDSLSERLSQKLKWPSSPLILIIIWMAGYTRIESKT